MRTFNNIQLEIVDSRWNRRSLSLALIGGIRLGCQLMSYASGKGTNDSACLRRARLSYALP